MIRDDTPPTGAAVPLAGLSIEQTFDSPASYRRFEGRQNLRPLLSWQVQPDWQDSLPDAG